MNEDRLSPNDVLTQSDISLQSILSSLSTETSNSIILENIRSCLKYMSTFDISRINNQLFQWIMPSIKTTLLKTFDDNFLISDTSDDEFVLNILKDNLQVILNLVHILKEILEFLVEHSEIKICDIKSVAITSIQVISSIFDYCKKSSETIKKDFNQDLLEIFKTVQEAHILFFKLFESCVVIAGTCDNNEEVDILLEVLDNLCDTSEILYSLNVKLLVTNLKGYLAIIEKFRDVIKNQIDLKKPTANLIAIISDNLSSVIDIVSLEYSIKFAGFLIKVLLNIFDKFWEYKKNILDEMIQFCCIIYSFSSHKLIMMDCPLEMVTFMENTIIFAQIKSFVARFLLDDSFIQVVQNKTLLSEKYCYGLLNLLNVCMECLVITDKIKNMKLDILFRLIFDSTKLCFQEFLWPESIFENLVINMSGVIMIYDNYYEKIEPILLENLLQEQIWNYFLSSEVWCLLLRNATPRFCVDTLINLIKIYNQLEFGNNTHRIEKIYLKYFMQRVYRLIPDYLKSQMAQNMNTNVDAWKQMDAQYFPKQLKNFVGDIHQLTLEKFDDIGTAKFTCKDFITLVENLELLSTVNFQNMCIDSLNLVNALEGIWYSAFNDRDNNLFKYFIAKVFKITSNFAMEFNNRQLYMILNQLTQLSSDDSFKLQISLMLFPFCLINSNQLGQDGCKLLKMLSNILTNLLQNSNNIVKQSVLELLDQCAQNDKQNVVREVVMSCDDMQTVITEYINKSCTRSKFDVEYFKMIAKYEYKHICVEWKHINSNSKNKRIKLDECYEIEKQINEDLPQQQNNSTIEPIKYKLKEFKFKPYKKKNKPTEETEDSKEEQVDEVLNRLNGEVKCLMNVLKSEKLTAKNVSKLKIITSQLTSLM